MSLLQGTQVLPRFANRQTQRLGSIRLSLPLLIVLIPLVIFLAALSISTLAFTGSSADPFTAYDALRPGNPASAVNGYRCATFASISYSRDLATYCQIRPENSPFTYVGILMRGGVIQEQTYRVQGLRVGDLVQRWGRPDEIRHRGSNHRLYWNNGLTAIVHTDNWFTLEAAVQIVLLRRPSALV